MMRTLWMAVAAVSSLAAQTADIRAFDPPASKESGMPFLTKSPDGKIYLSWVDMLGAEGHALRVSRWTGSGWNAPETIAQGRNWFANWADVPAISALADGSMLAHWLTKLPGGGTYDYGIRIARRNPADARWTQIHGMHLDNKTDYAGFLAFVPGEATAVYLSPPADAPSAAVSHHHDHDSAGHRKTLRFASFDGARAVPSDDLEVDADTCSCCPTAIARTPAGLIAVYRDHQPGEIRDISLVRQVKGKWTKPATIHPDNWQINGCPTEGPSIASQGPEVAVSWLTRAGGVSKVQMALSADSGATFAQPLRLDSGNPLGRPMLAVLPEAGGFAALWVEKVTTDRNEIRLRYWLRNGTLTPPQTIASVPAGRLSGIPRLIANGNSELLVAWRDEKVRVARIARRSNPNETTKR